MDYVSLVASKTTADSICAWTNWDLTPATSILSEAESIIYSSLRVPQMEALDEGTISTGDTSLEMPSDFIQPKSFRRIGSTAGEITVLDRQHFEERLPLDQDGEYDEAPPRTCTIYGSPVTAYFDSKADQDIPYRLLYIAKPAALSGSNTTNWLTRDYPFLIRSACLWMAFLHRKELQGAQIWGQITASLITACNGQGDLAQALVQFEMYTKQ